MGVTTSHEDAEADEDHLDNELVNVESDNENVHDSPSAELVKKRRSMKKRMKNTLKTFPAYEPTETFQAKVLERSVGHTEHPSQLAEEYRK